jgi:hypothetical protein
MFYTGLHRKVTRAGKLVRRGLLILSLLVVGLVPTIGTASAQGRDHVGSPGNFDNCTADYQPSNYHTYWAQGWHACD